MPEEKLIGRRNDLNDHVTDHAAQGNTSEFTPGTPMRSIIDRWVTRRGILKGSVALGVASFVGLHLADKNGAEAQVPTAPVLNFDAVPTSDFDAVVIPPGHSAQFLYAYGDPIAAGLSPFSNSGTEPGLEFDQRAGDHHDGVYFFGMDANGAYNPTANDRGILCINHENITQALMHANGPTTDANGNRTDVDEVRKEQRTHGVACIEVVRDETTGQFSVLQDSPFNHRITALTPVVLKGPAAGSPLLQTKFSPAGTDGRGTLNNCANGFTPWGTCLSCEENYDLYFRDERSIGDETRQTPEVLGFANFLAGIGVREPQGLYEWATLAGHPDGPAGVGGFPAEWEMAASPRPTMRRTCAASWWDRWVVRLPASR
jgi:secreted PhoX family phosphatase